MITLNKEVRIQMDNAQNRKHIILEALKEKQAQERADAVKAESTLIAAMWAQELAFREEASKVIKSLKAGDSVTVITQNGPGSSLVNEYPKAIFCGGDDNIFTVEHGGTRFSIGMSCLMGIQAEEFPKEDEFA